MSYRDEWIAEAILDAEDEEAWRAQRNIDLGLHCGWVTRAEMIASHAAERAAVESQGLDGYEWRAASLPAEMRDRDGDAA